jgi:dTDP-4-amino-4,6-dideoxygalactose transaminase
VLDAWRHELPAYSPVPARALLAAGAARLLGRRHELDAVRDLLANGYQASQIILTDSGRSALALGIRAALSRSERRLVAVPAFQCYEVATAVVAADCDVVAYDVDPVSLTPDLVSLERALAAGATVVIIAPLYGVPVDWPAITALARRFGAVAIEDAAQSHGAKWQGRSLGSLGELSVLSFGRGKGWTGGGGGALLLRGPGAQRDLEQLAGLRAIGPFAEVRTAVGIFFQIALGRPRLYGLPASIPALALGQTIYHEPTAPMGFGTFSAALLRRTMDTAEHEAQFRRNRAEAWKAELPEPVRSGVPPVLPGGTAGYLRFPLRVRPQNATEAKSPGYRRAGIAPSYPRPLTELEPLAKRLVGGDRVFPGADALARELITLPTHSRLTDSGRAAILAITFSWSKNALPRS